jgi:hypothetical protein
MRMQQVQGAFQNQINSAKHFKGEKSLLEEATPPFLDSGICVLKKCLKIWFCLYPPSTLSPLILPAILDQSLPLEVEKIYPE